MRIIAHRGDSDALPEQTRAACLGAIAAGADGVECDVRLSADRRVVCIHDATVDRTSDGTGAVHELTLDQLRALDYCAWMGADIPAEWAAGEQLLTLADVVALLGEAGRPMTLAVELKHPNPFDLELEDAVLAELRGVGWDGATSSVGTVTVDFMSFNPASVMRLAPEVPLRYLSMLTEDLTLADLGADVPGEMLASGPTTELAAQLQAALDGGRRLVDAGATGGVVPGIDFAHAHEDLVRAWIAAGRWTRVWTVDDAADALWARDLGIQELTTNRPAAMRAALES